MKDEISIGFALGLASHGIGTARAFQLSEQTGAFAALTMGLNGLSPRCCPGSSSRRRCWGPSGSANGFTAACGEACRPDNPPFRLCHAFMDLS